MLEFKDVKDSGKRQEFTTGSVRDTDEGKGQPHLIAGEAFAKIQEYNRKECNIIDGYLGRIENLLLKYAEIVDNREKNIELIYNAFILTLEMIAKEQENDSYSNTLKRFAQHYSNGAKKYAKNNWRKGQPISRYYDSAMRHLWTLMDDKKDEDHSSALLWNLLAIVQTKLDIEKMLLPKELNDFPFIIEETFLKKE